MTRAHPTADTGNIGEAMAVAAFGKIGWPATLTTGAQDLGTDLMISARDRLFHSGEIVSAQVKSGASNLDEPIHEEGTHTAWWVRVELRHVDYWLASASPHLLVLYDHQTDICHWVHITEQSITRTGAGAKVRVPKAHIVERAQLPALQEIAAMVRASVPLEGTAWTGAPPAASTDRLRFALIVPRLIAPHPNRGAAPGSPTEAVALIVQAREDAVWRPLVAHAGVPAREDARVHADWPWQFAAALADWIGGTGEPDFEALRDATKAPHERVAATIVAAHRLIADGTPEPAQALLQEEIKRDWAAPVDHAWLHLQLARALVELAELETARAAAARALTIGATQPHDVTATAIRGTAAAIVFNSDPFGERDLGTMIEQGDTAVGWWRSQTALTGTTALVRTAFDQAVGGEAARHDRVRSNNELLAALTQAGLLGSQGQWRSYCGLLARQQLITATATATASDPDEIADRLLLLRESGDEKATARATAWFVAHGPADAVTTAARTLDLARSTTGSVFADLALLEAAGDALEPDSATAAAEWLFAALDDPARFLALTYRMGFDPQQRIAQHLIGIVQAIPERGAELAVAALERHGATFGTLAAIDWSRLVSALPEWAWTHDLADRLAAVRYSGEAGQLHAAIRSVRLAFDPTERDALVASIVAGNLRWTGYLDGFEHVSAAGLDDLIATYAARTTADLQQARAGSLTHEVGVYALDWLVAALLQRPDDANWAVVVEALDDAFVPASDKRGAIREIAVGRERIAPDIRVALAPAIVRASERQPVRSSAFDVADIAAEVAGARWALTGAGNADATIGRLARGGVRHRIWAAWLAGETANLGALAILAADREPVVRGAAARGLARHVAKHGGDDTTVALLEGAVSDRGRVTGMQVAWVIAEHVDGHALESARALLVTHPSATVRRLAAYDAHSESAA